MLGGAAPHPPDPPAARRSESGSRRVRGCGCRAGGAPHTVRWLLSIAHLPKESKMMRVGNAPVSWGVYEADRLNPPYGEVLDGIARAGYAGTELGPFGYLPTSPRELDHELRSRR